MSTLLQVYPLITAGSQKCPWKSLNQLALLARQPILQKSAPHAMSTFFASSSGSFILLWFMQAMQLVKAICQPEQSTQRSR